VSASAVSVATVEDFVNCARKSAPRAPTEIPDPGPRRPKGTRTTQNPPPSHQRSRLTRNPTFNLKLNADQPEAVAVGTQLFDEWTCMAPDVDDPLTQ